VVEQGLHRRDGVRWWRRGFHVPPARDPRGAVDATHELVRGKELRDPPKQRARCWRVVEGQEVMKRLLVERGRRQRGQHPLDLRREDEETRLRRVEERFDAETITDEPQLARTVVPQPEGEHAVEAMQACASPLEIGGE